MTGNNMPYDKGLDHTLEVLLKEGYEYILSKRKELDSNVFSTRLLGEETICLSGQQAAKLFYDQSKFKRDGAMPNRVLNTLFGQTGVQTLDDKAHKHRKQMFMPLLSPESSLEVKNLAEKEWEAAIDKWKGTYQVVLYDEVQVILTKTMAKWAGIPVEENDYGDLAKDLVNMFEAAAKIGFPHHAGKKSRKNREAWLVAIVKSIKAGELKVPENKILYDFVWFKDINHTLLDERTVAVELLNLLRPIVAVAVYINFVAFALHDYPEQKTFLQNNAADKKEMFVQEVRRFYPFFPFAGARVKQNFEWEGFTFEKDTLTLLDLYGTNHDKSIWNNPNTFDPSRFLNRKENEYDFIPQGGRDYMEGHRCPGEWFTIEMMKVALEFKVYRMEYEFLEQDFSYSMTEMPSVPKDRIILNNIKAN